MTAVLIGLAVIAWFTIRRRSLLGLGTALIVMPIIPALAMVRIYPQWEMTSDRYLYLPSVGLSLLFAMVAKQMQIWSLEKLAKVAMAIVVIAVLMPFSAETIAQQRFYQDDVAFYSRVIEVTPANAFARGMLGYVYLDEKHTDLALEELRKANQIAPDDRKVSLLLARGLFVAGEKHETEGVLKELLEASDPDSKVWTNVTTDGPHDWDVALGLMFPNWAALNQGDTRSG